jgi:hypothetical protein
MTKLGVGTATTSAGRRATILHIFLRLNLPSSVHIHNNSKVFKDRSGVDECGLFHPEGAQGKAVKQSSVPSKGPRRGPAREVNFKFPSLSRCLAWIFLISLKLACHCSASGLATVTDSSKLPQLTAVYMTGTLVAVTVSESHRLRLGVTAPGPGPPLAAVDSDAHHVTDSLCALQWQCASADVSGRRPALPSRPLDAHHRLRQHFVSIE